MYWVYSYAILDMQSEEIVSIAHLPESGTLPIEFAGKSAKVNKKSAPDVSMVEVTSISKRNEESSTNVAMDKEHQYLN